MWFQRKAFLASGRTEDARTQLEQIRAFCEEEGIPRLETVSSALLAEARRQIDEADHTGALETLTFADVFDPGNPQVHRARATALWRGGGGLLAAGRELAASVRLTLVRSIEGLDLFYPLMLLATLAIVGGFVVFAGLMLLRHQAALRHEIEERLRHAVGPPWASALGWAVIALPLLTWIGAGWVTLYWILLTFRYMTRGERAASVLLLLAVGLSGPAREIGIAVYSASADPAARSAMAAASGGYAPERIMKLRQLVDSHPEDPVYRFLLAGLYKNGRYFEEAFAEYKEALRLEPTLGAAYINIGNIYFATGQYAESVNQYRRAIELSPHAFLAHFNTHLAQSEAFRFGDAEAALTRARDIDASRVARLLASGEGAARPTVRDATLGLESLWQTALRGGITAGALASTEATPREWIRSAFQPTSLIFLLAPFVAGLTLWFGRGSAPSLPCIRCGTPFCRYCKSEKEAREYCSQCLHLFVLGDGLAARNKSRKLYEVERHERVTRSVRRILSLFLPGAGQVLRGRAARGVALTVLWIAALIAWRPEAFEYLGGLGGADLGLHVIDIPAVPTAFRVHAIGLLGLLALPVIWLLGNGRLRWRREA